VGKSKNLKILEAHGIPVPRGFVLDASHFEEAVAPIRGMLRQALDSHVRISSLFLDLPMPERTKGFIEDAL